jgi:hypothetical protein
MAVEQLRYHKCGEDGLEFESRDYDISIGCIPKLNHILNDWVVQLRLANDVKEHSVNSPSVTI